MITRVKVSIRRVNRHPTSQKIVRSTSYLKRHVVKNAVMSLIPDALNDFAFHHAHVDVNEMMHVVQDTTIVALMTSLVTVTKIMI